MTDWPLAAAVSLVAAIYASVGHAGATGYIAVMTLWGLAPEVIRPTALVLNVIVASIATVQFARAGHLDRRLLTPLVAASVPTAAIGGWLALPTRAFEMIVAAALAVAAVRLVGEAVVAAGPHGSADAAPAARPPAEHHSSRAVLATVGGFVGLLSGLTGIGGGVFLSPILLALRAGPVRTVAATSAAFILVNSLAGLAGGVAAGHRLVPIGGTLIAAVVIGGALGSHLGAFRLPARILRLLMGGVLVVAGIKLVGQAVAARAGDSGAAAAINGSSSQVRPRGLATVWNAVLPGRGGGGRVFQAIDRPVGAEVERPVHGGRGGEDLAVELVGREQFERASRPDDERGPVTVADVDPPIGVQRRR